MTKRKNLTKVTKKMAAALVKQELGLPGTWIKRSEDDYSPDVFVYRMQLGNFNVTIDNDWFGDTNLIILDIRSDGPHIRMYFNPETMERDYDAECRWRED